MTLLAPFLSEFRMAEGLGRGVDPSREESAVDRERRVFEGRMGGAWPEIVRLIERLLAWPGAGAEVEDVAQDVFFAAWKARGDFRGEAEWSTWVYAIAVRRARNAARSRSRRERWFGRLLPGALLDGEPSRDLTEEAASVSSATSRALAGLKHPDREVLVLRYLEERTIDEIASWLGLSRAAVDARLSRARARLKERMGPALEGPL
ncbi:MAG: sigma-70 family RNA polymerase sigma factor [Planctomycetota bacterium]